MSGVELRPRGPKNRLSAGERRERGVMVGVQDARAWVN